MTASWRGQKPFPGKREDQAQCTVSLSNGGLDRYCNRTGYFLPLEEGDRFMPPKRPRTKAAKKRLMRLKLERKTKKKASRVMPDR
jgi:hypothetical protein